MSYRDRTAMPIPRATIKKLQTLPDGQFTLAFTLGHTILGQTDAALDISRDHEMVHVRQYERWGSADGACLSRLLIGIMAHAAKALPRQSL